MINVMKNKYNSTIFLYYILIFCTNLFFYEGVWVLYWNKYMTYQLLGIVGAVAFVIGLILEIPSGAIADTIGRKKIIVVSLMFFILSGILLTSATNALFLIGGVIFLQFGVSFLSGTLEALLYDNMKDSGIADRFDIVISRGIVLGILGVAVSIFVGGYVYDLGNRLPYMFWTLSSLVALIAAFYLKDSQKYDEKDMAESWLVNFKDGIYELVKPNNRYISFSILTTFGVFYYFDWGFYKSVIAIENGMSAFVQSSVFSTSNIIASIFIFMLLPRLYSRLNKKLILMGTSLLIGVSLLYLTRRLDLYAAVPITLVIIGGNVFSSAASVLLNERVESEHRATTLSAATFLSKIVFILLTAISGKLIEMGKLDDITVFLSMIALSPLFIFLFMRKRAKHIYTKS
ncbi:MAG: hypothetical protein RLY61_41 [Candidatus Parcubacteria bacterium]